MTTHPDNPIKIITGDSVDATVAASIIGVAFETLLASEWLVPDNAKRTGILTAFMQLHVDDALAGDGMVEMTADKTAVAVWYPIDQGRLPDPSPDYEEQLFAACGEDYATNFQLLEATFAAHHPTEEAHHHLAFLAVLPELQRSGLGSALLRHHAIANPGVPFYLEASSPGSRRLYASHGYHDMGDFSLPDGPKLWRMWQLAF